MSEIEKLKDKVKQVEDLIEEAGKIYMLAVQELVNKHRVHLATGGYSDLWQVKFRTGKIWRGEFDKPIHPIFKELRELDKIGSDLRIGPTNLMRFFPKKDVSAA